MKNIDLTKYDLTNPNITGAFICKQENCARDTLYFYLRKYGISLRGRGLSDKAKKAMFGKKSLKRSKNPFTFFMTRFYKQWRTGADSRNIEFSIKLGDIISLYEKQNGLCALSGEPMKKQDSDEYDISLDRIDSSLCYNIDNIHLVLKQVNYMKQAYPQESFINLCCLIAKNNDRY